MAIPDLDEERFPAGRGASLYNAGNESGVSLARKEWTMKTIALEPANSGIADALKHQRREEPILLKSDSDAVGLLLRLPEGTKDLDLDAVWIDEPSGFVVVFIQAKYSPGIQPETKTNRAVFGSCKGMMTIVSEDDEHLKDFAEYMP